MKCRTMVNCLCVVLMAVLSPVVLAQATQPAQAPVRPIRPKTEAQIVAEITQQLTSQVAADRQQALEAIRQRMQRNGMYELRNWLRQLFAAKQYTEVADLAQEGILGFPAETRYLEQTLVMRIKSLLALGKTQEALSEAKGLFNVATMTGTAEAILVVAECLNAAYPDDPEIFNRFREEQLAGAATATTQPTTVPTTGARSSVLDAIKVNPKPYDETLKKLNGEDAMGLLARGNLLLLADRPKEARVLFNRMYSLVGSDLAEASEAIARCIKAEDGTIGRANTWVYSIRPKKPG